MKWETCSLMFHSIANYWKSFCLDFAKTTQANGEDIRWNPYQNCLVIVWISQFKNCSWEFPLLPMYSFLKLSPTYLEAVISKLQFGGWGWQVGKVLQLSMWQRNNAVLFTYTQHFLFCEISFGVDYLNEIRGARNCQYCWIGVSNIDIGASVIGGIRNCWYSGIWGSSKDRWSSVIKGIRNCRYCWIGVFN